MNDDCSLVAHSLLGHLGDWYFPEFLIQKQFKPYNGETVFKFHKHILN